MFSKIAVLMCVVAVAFAAVPTIDICSASDALLTNLKIKLTPDSIVPGQNVTISVSGDLTKSVSDASAALSATFDGFPVFSKTMDPCKKDPKICPFPAGTFKYDIEHVIPKIPMSGTVAAKAVMTAEPSGTQIVCLKISMDI